jgi:hypothetical protein
MRIVCDMIPDEHGVCAPSPLGEREVRGLTSKPVPSSGSSDHLLHKVRRKNLYKAMAGGVPGQSV